jgi:hypothetical protein
MGTPIGTGLFPGPSMFVVKTWTYAAESPWKALMPRMIIEGFWDEAS